MVWVCLRELAGHVNGGDRLRSSISIIVAAMSRRSHVMTPLLCAVGMLAMPVAATIAQSGPDVMVVGRVTDALGLPIAGIEIYLQNLTVATFTRNRWSPRSIDDRDHRTASTDSDGRFRLRVRSAGSVLISASGPGPTAMGITVDPGVTRDLPVLQLELGLTQLPQVSISARSPETRASIPGATTTVGSDQLHSRAPLSVAAALRSVAGLHVADEDPYGLALNIGIRGLPPRRSSRTLLLEDGVPILLGPYGDPSMHYAPPMETLERIEIVKGSGQIRNGPQTLAGVVNFVTMTPPSAGRTAELKLGGGALNFRNALVRVGMGSQTAGFAVDFTHREGGGIRIGESHRLQHVSLNARRTVANLHVLSLKLAQWNESSTTVESGLTQQEFDTNPLVLSLVDDGRFEVKRHVAQLTHVSSLGDVVLRTNAYVSRTNRASWRQSGESGERLGAPDYADDFNCAPNALSYGECGNQGRPRTYVVAGIEPKVEVTLGDIERGVKLDAGMRVYAESVRRRQFVGATATSRESSAELTRDNGIESRVLAGYMQSRVFSGMWSVSPGLRIERVAQEIRNRFPGSEAAITQMYTQLLPGIGVSVSPSSNATFFVGAHRGFAPPRPADIYRPEPGQSVVLVDPELSLNLELGTRITSSRGAQFEATLFQMDFRNEILEAPANAGQRFINGGQTLHRGVELAANLALPMIAQGLPDLSLRSSYTYLPIASYRAGGNRDPLLVGNRLPYAPEHLVTASIAYAHRAFTVGTSFEFVGGQFADPQNLLEASADGQEGALPAYTVTSAFGSYALPLSGWQLRASVRNLFDRVYITQRNEGILTGVRRLARVELHWRY